MSYSSFCCRLENHEELHHSKNYYRCYEIDAYGSFKNVKTIKGLVNAKKYCLELKNNSK